MNQDDNPYRAPSSQVRDVSQAREVVPAGRWRRFGTFVVDYGGVLMSVFVLTILIAIIFGRRGIAFFHDIPSVVTGSVLYFLYYLIFEGLWARTPGKWVFGTLVVDEAGGKPSIKQVLGRTACRFIPFEPFSALSPDTPPWHDSIPKTRVVRYR
jgi:uncharacterized RDD family membrane protein YckC